MPSALLVHNSKHGRYSGNSRSSSSGSSSSHSSASLSVRSIHKVVPALAPHPPTPPPQQQQQQQQEKREEMSDDDDHQHPLSPRYHGRNPHIPVALSPFPSGPQRRSAAGADVAVRVPPSHRRVSSHTAAAAAVTAVRPLGSPDEFGMSMRSPCPRPRPPLEPKGDASPLLSAAAMPSMYLMEAIPRPAAEREERGGHVTSQLQQQQQQHPYTPSLTGGSMPLSTHSRPLPLQPTASLPSSHTSRGRTASRNESSTQFMGAFSCEGMQESDMPPGLMRFLQEQKQQQQQQQQQEAQQGSLSALHSQKQRPSSVLSAKTPKLRTGTTAPARNSLPLSLPLLSGSPLTAVSPIQLLPPHQHHDSSKQQQQQQQSRLLHPQPQPHPSLTGTPNAFWFAAATPAGSRPLNTVAAAAGTGASSSSSGGGVEVLPMSRSEEWQRSGGRPISRPHILSESDVHTCKLNPLSEVATKAAALPSSLQQQQRHAHAGTPSALATMNTSSSSSKHSGTPQGRAAPRRFTPYPPTLTSPLSAANTPAAAAVAARNAERVAQTRASGSGRPPLGDSDSSRSQSLRVLAPPALSDNSHASLPISALIAVLPPALASVREEQIAHSAPSAMLHRVGGPGRCRPRLSAKPADTRSGTTTAAAEEEVEEDGLVVVGHGWVDGSSSAVLLDTASSHALMQSVERSRRGSVARRGVTNARSTSLLASLTTTPTTTTATTATTPTDGAAASSCTTPHPRAAAAAATADFKASMIGSPPLMLRFASVMPTPPSTANHHNNNNNSHLNHHQHHHEQQQQQQRAGSVTKSTSAAMQAKAALLIAKELEDAPPMLRAHHHSSDEGTPSPRPPSTHLAANHRPSPVTTSGENMTSMEPDASLLNSSTGGLNFVETPLSPGTDLEPSLMAGVSWLDSFSLYTSVTSPTGTHNTTTHSCSTAFANSMTQSIAGLCPVSAAAAAAAMVALAERSSSRIGTFFGSPSQSVSARQQLLQRKSMTPTTTTTNTAAAAVAMEQQTLPSPAALAVPAAPTAGRTRGSRRGGTHDRRAVLSARSANVAGSNAGGAAAVRAVALLPDAESSVVTNSSSSGVARYRAPGTRLAGQSATAARNTPALAEMQESLGASPLTRSSMGASMVSFMRSPSASMC